MIYVRTRHSVHEATEENSKFIIGKDGISASVKVVKKAKRIQTICDGFYLDRHGDMGKLWPNGFFLRYRDAMIERKEWIEFFSSFKKDRRPTVYGFIRTEKGFEFVAKTDEKGKLRLLWKD